VSLRPPKVSNVLDRTSEVMNWMERHEWLWSFPSFTFAKHYDVCDEETSSAVAQKENVGLF
jgi:hypothetical protein